MSSSVPNARVLLVEDTDALARTYMAMLAAEPVEVSHAATAREALDGLERFRPDLVLLDLILPDMDGFEVLERLGALPAPPAVVVITANGSIGTAVRAMQGGAVDFLPKPFDAKRLIKTVRSALESSSAQRAIGQVAKETSRDMFADFIGASPAMQAVYRMIENVAPSKASVFITGESGTGKDVSARAIHDLSPRSGQPFVAINCGAIPKDLMESEIFGHVKGAFTGATESRPGAARKANGGTLFLDEIGEMDLNLQTKLLRFIQTGEVQPVGSNDTIPVDLRIICATNKDPQAAVARGEFREDLFYRLHVVPLSLPPLCERGRDIVLIAEAFLERFAAEEGKRFDGFSRDAEAALMAHSWPGNVRELQNVIRRLVVFFPGGPVTVNMLPIGSPATRPAGHTAVRPVVAAAAADDTRGDPNTIRPLWQVEKEAIERAVLICEGNINLAAALLGINPSTIYRKRQSWAKGIAAAE